jgi:hypothetical protein
MSDYAGHAINPRTEQVEEAWFLDNRFGRHRYGVRFAGEEKVWNADEVKRVPAPSDKGA